MSDNLNKVSKSDKLACLNRLIEKHPDKKEMLEGIKKYILNEVFV